MRHLPKTLFAFLSAALFALATSPAFAKGPCGGGWQRSGAGMGHPIMARGGPFGYRPHLARRTPRQGAAMAWQPRMQRSAPMQRFAGTVRPYRQYAPARRATSRPWSAQRSRAWNTQRRPMFAQRRLPPPMAPMLRPAPMRMAPPMARMMPPAHMRPRQPTFGMMPRQSMPATQQRLPSRRDATERRSMMASLPFGNRTMGYHYPGS